MREIFGSGTGATCRIVGTFANMKAELITRFRDIAEDGTGLEMVVWRVPDPVPPSEHRFKYRLVYVVAGPGLPQLPIMDSRLCYIISCTPRRNKGCEVVKAAKRLEINSI